MEAIFDFPSILREAQGLFEDKTKVPVAEKERKNFRTDSSGHKYMLAIKDNKVACVWVGNVRKRRIGNRKKDGTCTVFSVKDITTEIMYDYLRIREGFTQKEWDGIGLDLIRLHEQLNETP